MMKPSVSLRAKSLDKFAGILAIVWSVGGYALFRAGAAGYPGPLDSPQSALLITLVWFGVSLLLVIAGLRRGNIVGRVCSFATIGMLLWLTDPFHGMIRGVENLFRKNEYAQVYYGAPECRVRATIHTDREVATFFKTLKQFAKQQNIRECRQKLYLAYSGPSLPTHKGEHVAIWSGVSWITNASEKTGGIRLAPYDEAYPVEDFKRLADSLASTMRSAFPGRVEVTYKEPVKP